MMNFSFSNNLADVSCQVDGTSSQNTDPVSRATPTKRLLVGEIFERPTGGERIDDGLKLWLEKLAGKSGADFAQCMKERQPPLKIVFVQLDAERRIEKITTVCCCSTSGKLQAEVFDNKKSNREVNLLSQEQIKAEDFETWGRWLRDWMTDMAETPRSLIVPVMPNEASKPPTVQADVRFDEKRAQEHLENEHGTKPLVIERAFDVSIGKPTGEDNTIHVSKHKEEGPVLEVAKKSGVCGFFC